MARAVKMCCYMTILFISIFRAYLSASRRQYPTDPEAFN